LNNKPLINTEVSLGGTFYGGGLKLFTIKSTLKTNIDINRFNSNTFLQYGFNKTFNSIVQNDFFGYEIISIGKKKRFHPKFAGMYEKSKIKSIDNYYVVGVGIGWNILKKTKYKLVMINSISYEEKQFMVDKSLNYKGIRYSAILNGEYVLLKDKLIIKHSFFINPFLFNSINNYRYRLLTDILMPLSKRISAKMSFNYTNESAVDTGFKQINYSTIFGLSLKL
jgi:hypothetical protein